MLHIGEPQQSIEMDLDMLAPDFYLLSTTSDHGSKFESFFSSTHGNSILGLWLVPFADLFQRNTKILMYILHVSSNLMMSTCSKIVAASPNVSTSPHAHLPSIPERLSVRMVAFWACLPLVR